MPTLQDKINHILTEEAARGELDSRFFVGTTLVLMWPGGFNRIIEKARTART